MLRNMDTDDKVMYGLALASLVATAILYGPGLLRSMEYQGRTEDVARTAAQNSTAALALAGDCTTGVILPDGEALKVGAVLLAVETRQPLPTGTVACLETGHVAYVGESGAISDLFFSAELRDHYKRKGFAQQNDHELRKRGGDVR